MADDLLSAFLGGATTASPYPDLSQFQKTVASNNIYNQVAAPILGAQFNTQTWSPTEVGAVSAGQAFLGSLFNRLGQREEAAQLNAAAAALPALYADPLNAPLPSTIDPEAAAQLRMSAVRQKVTDEAKQKVSAQSNLDSLALQLWSKDPDLIPPQIKTKLGLPETTMRPASDTSGISIDPDIPKSAQEKIMQTFRKLVHEEKAPPGAALEAAMKLHSAETTALKGSTSQNAKTRAAANKGLEVADAAEAAITRAGETGGLLGPARDFLSAAYASVPLGGGPAKEREQRAAQAELESLAPDIIKSARDAGAGAMSDREMASYLSAGPGSAKTPAENLALIQKAKNVNKIALDYADFKDYYADKYGTLNGAEKLWQSYKAENPLFIANDKGELVVNSERPSWQTFVSPTAAAEQLPAVAPQTKTANNIDLRALAKNYPKTEAGRAAFKAQAQRLTGGSR